MVEKILIGKTLEGRDQVGLRIHSPGAFNPTKKAFYFHSCQHAREWVSPPTTLYSVKTLLERYTTDPKVKDLLDNINIHYIPVVNVDGYVYTWTNTRLWRKNRRGGYGVDLNRNWRSGFGGPGSSGVRSSETYRGEFALSEPETSNIVRYLQNQTRILASIDFHSFSQLILRPWAQNNSLSRDENVHRVLGADLSNAILSVHRTNYRSIRAIEMYVASGYNSDHLYDINRFDAFLIELRPQSAGEGGFILPPRFILPCAQENYQAVLKILEHVRNKNV